MNNTVGDYLKSYSVILAGSIGAGLLGWAAFLCYWLGMYCIYAAAKVLVYTADKNIEK